MLAGHNACAGAGRCGGTGQSWHSRRRMRGSGSIGRRQRVVIEVVHMQPQYTPATRGAACARTRRWTPAARDMAIRMLASRWCAEKSPMGSVTCSENNRGRAQGCLHASLFHPLTLFIHSHFENTHVGPPRPAPQSPTGRGYGGTPGSHSPHHRAPRDWARMRILAVSFLKKVALNQLH
jgi:hypothetical protein